jgi:hypothetical protein
MCGDPAPRCLTAKMSRALEPGEGNGLAEFAGEIEYDAWSRGLQWRFGGIAWPRGRYEFGASAAMNRHRRK